MQILIRSVFAFWLMVAAGLAQASWDEAAAVVDGATHNVLAVLDDESMKEEARFGDLLVEIDRVLTPVVDFDYISKRVMGKYYRRANAQQREQFSGVFKTTLLKTYARALVGFQIESYRLAKPAKPSPKAEKQAVSVVVKSANGTEFTLVYFMLKREGVWTLVNASLDGINLRLTFKNQFASMAQEQRGKVAAVIASWKKQVDTAAGQEG